MKSFGVSVAAAAALSLSLVAPAVGSSSHHNNLAAHKRRFDRVHRAADSPEQASHEVIDVDVNAGGLVVRNATPVVGGLAAEDAEQSHHLSKRGYNGRATFFEPGLGACGTYSGAGDFVRLLRSRHTRAAA